MHKNKGKKAGGRCGRWASGGTLRFVIRVMGGVQRGDEEKERLRGIDLRNNQVRASHETESLCSSHLAAAAPHSPSATASPMSTCDILINISVVELVKETTR